MLYGFSQVILQGALVTLELALSSVVLAVLIGLAGAGAKLSSNRPLALVFEGYTTLIRGVPDLVLMLLIFYGLQIALNSVTDALGMAQFDIDPMIAGIITLGFIYGAYFTETFRGAYLAVPKGHIEAATAFGFSGGQTFRRIPLPGDDALRAAGDRQQLAGYPQGDGAGLVAGAGGCGQSHAAGREKHLAAVLLRHRLRPDLSGVYHRF
ncbi:Histidine ABC transporter [Klebsiella pneumoniae]|uniref:Histidine ABC transporter n=1 Tax=Klebsiella pneumoniae TaxID=573 RepID=A0A378C079_KLEPN|nr:Histidine ABC transporter [Klebsiella pneumoniae]